MRAHRPRARLAVSTATALLLAGVPVGAAAGDDDTISATLKLASDYVWRGISQTQGSMAVQASLDLELPSGLYAYVWGSNVDYTLAGQPDDGSSHEINLAIGYARELSDRWQIDLRMVSYLFPGLVDGENYDYVDFIGRLELDERHHLTFAATDNVDNTGKQGTYLEAGSGIDLRYGLSADLSYGYFDLDSAYRSSYSYLKATIARPMGDASVALDVIETFGSAEALYGRAAADSRLVLSVEFGF